MRTFTVFTPSILQPQSDDNIIILESFLQARDFAKSHPEMTEQEILADTRDDARNIVATEQQRMKEMLGYFLNPASDEFAQPASLIEY